MAEYRITYWRDIPSMVTARDAGGATAKTALCDRFQEAIDEAAMRGGLAGSDAYLEQWRHGDWETADGDAADLAAAIADRLEAQYGPDRLAQLVGA